jgi:hypothetical protein
MDVIVNLPPDVLRSVVVDWLHLEDITRLDSAACGRAFRGELLRQLYTNSNLYYRYRNKYSEALVSWTAMKLPLLCQVHFLDKVIKSLRKTNASYKQSLSKLRKVVKAVYNS